MMVSCILVRGIFYFSRVGFILRPKDFIDFFKTLLVPYI